MIKFPISSPLKERIPQSSLCTNCIHKCSIKGITLCNIDKNPSLFYNSFINNPIKQCEDYCSIDKAYPKINIHSIWDWCNNFVHPTPIILCCKHDLAEYEQPSIDEVLPQSHIIANTYNIKLKGFPWVINLGEVSETKGVKLYRTHLLSDTEINNILRNIKQ